LLTVTPSASAKFLCDGLCARLDKGLTERLETSRRNEQQQCRSSIQDLYQTQKARNEGCDCFPPDKLKELLEDLTHTRDREFARCDVKGIEAAIAFAGERQKEHRARLRELVAQFQARSRDADALREDSRRVLANFVGKLGEVALGQIVSGILKGNEKEFAKRIDELIKHAKGIDPRRISSGLLKEWVVALRADMKGKSAKQARAILLASLAAAPQKAEEQNVVKEQIASALAKFAKEGTEELALRITRGPGDGEVGEVRKSGSGTAIEGFLLDQAYASGVSLLKIERVRTLEKSLRVARAVSVLGLLPDVVDMTEILYRATVINRNIDGLETLLAAAERERNTAGTEMRLLVHHRRLLETEHKKALAEMPR
jgi:hypothetical protein